MSISNHISLSEAKERIKGRVGKSVNFRYPDGRKRTGLLKDRVLVTNEGAHGDKVYIDVIDLIDFDDEEENIRFGYYIYEDGNYKWGSQTTLTEPKSLMLRLFRKAYTQTLWFKELIEEICESG